MKIVTVIGTRPQIIKASILMNELKKTNHENILVYTGQHYSKELSDIFFQELNLQKPDYNLHVGSGSYHYQITTGVKCLTEILELEKPDRIVTIGDSNPALVGAKSAIHKNIHLIHCEAGLRSNAKNEPEEKNRIFIDSHAHQLFCSTTECLKNLSLEKVKAEPVLTGDLLYDSWKKYKPFIKKPDLKCFHYGKIGKFCLLTLHRKSNLHNITNLKNIIKMLINNWDFPTIFSIHPGTKKKLKELSILDDLENKKNFWMVEPLSYLEMRWIESHCSIVMTDSVGIQVEAYLCQKPCIILREEIEHKCLEKLGWSIRISPKSNQLFGCYELMKSMINTSCLNYDDKLFGCGDAAIKMANRITQN